VFDCLCIGGEWVAPTLLPVEVVSPRDGLIETETEAAPASIDHKGLRFSSFINNGQACAAQARVLVPRHRHDEMVDALEAAIARFVVVDPLDLATGIGPVVSRAQSAKARAFSASGSAPGARVAIGGDLRSGPHGDPLPRRGRRDPPGNDSPFGLTGSVWTADVARGREVGLRIRTGTFGVNRYGPDPTSPFGGCKASGVGHEYGREGLRAFVEVKKLLEV